MAEITIGELSHRTGIPVSALHFYERKGLISSERTAANHRIYKRSVIRRITVIRIAQKAGLTLKQISEALQEIPQEKVVSQQNWETLSKKWRDELTERIELLTMLRDDLSDCIGCGCLSLEQCPLVNEDDKLAALGPGAHLIKKSYYE